MHLGIDLGTSGCRAIAIDDDGAIIAESRAPLPPSQQPVAQASEQNPQDWWRAVTETLLAIDEQVRNRVRAIAVDGTSASLLLCEPDGTPLTPALMYNDARAGSQARRIAQIAPDDSPARGATSALAKLMYLQEQTPGMDIRALHQADWIVGKLTARFGVSDENNCLKLGFDPRERRWPDWIARLGLGYDVLPDVLPVGAAITRLAPTVATQLRLPVDTLIVAGTTDSNAATLAAGINDVGQAVTSLGSTLVVKVMSERPVFSARHGIYSHRIGEHWLVGGASNSGGRVLRQYFHDEQLRTLSQRIDAKQESGLDYYPLPAPGERFPIADAELPPRLVPRPDDPAHFLHGLLEGIARIEAAGYARLAELGAPRPRRVFTSGGGATNETWQRIRERLLRVPVLRATHSEAAYGTALLARDAI